MKLFLNDRQCRFLLNISKQDGKKNINQLGKEIYSTYKSKYELYTLLRKLDLIYVIEDSKEVIPYLTVKGKDACENICKLMALS